MKTEVCSLQSSYLTKSDLLPEAFHRTLDWLKQGKLVIPEITSYPWKKYRGYRDLESEQTIAS